MPKRLKWTLGWPPIRRLPIQEDQAASPADQSDTQVSTPEQHNQPNASITTETRQGVTEKQGSTFIEEAGGQQEVAKWLAAPLAGIGLTLGAGLKVSDVAATGDYRELALAAGPIGVLGLLIGLGFTALAIRPSKASIETAINNERFRKRLLREADRLKLLITDPVTLRYASKLRELAHNAPDKTPRQVAELLAEDTGDNPKSKPTNTARLLHDQLQYLPDALQVLKDKFDAAAEPLLYDARTELDSAREQLNGFATYITASRRVRLAIGALVVASLIVLASLSLPAVATSLDEADRGDAAKITSPTNVLVWLAPEETDKVREERGGQSLCTPTQGFRAVAIGGDWRRPLLLFPAVSDKTGKTGYVCPPYRLTVSNSSSIVQPDKTTPDAKTS